MVESIKQLIKDFLHGILDLFRDEVNEQIENTHEAVNRQFGWVNQIHLSTVQLFHDLNQWDEKWSWNACTFFAPAINIKYNCGITLTEDDIKIIASEQFDLWKFQYWSGWKIEDWVYAIQDYITKHQIRLDIKKLPTLTKYISYEQVSRTRLLKMLRKWYAAVMWVWVSQEFIDDVKDGRIDTIDYNELKWEVVNHATNIAWFDRSLTDSIPYTEFILDSYAYNKKDRQWVYKCDAKKIVENIGFNTYFIFTKD